MILRYDRRSTGTTVDGRGNPIDLDQRTIAALRPVVARFDCSRPPMAAPGGAAFGWAGIMVLRSPVFHPRPCAAAPNAAAYPADLRRVP